ncbi:uncharacterized protein ASPGLDRAFT_44992 [Aspergillus glaucus CBS 516.65]|uniref:Uncharacterized protein n=1 Tax=Aspergillus glaucus CBS 516.65 TaxID=1160497 RepID=A0A1L9VQ00_ASPGL|nr:hypothetical protein ASPGLDRAFT_44992 [Aspergillus glaucus CBS 516.65]OJJ85997.1 hypothetical protein ASPGLDRAFT_44992 [Aspergillus glaucus CBS 516.65]
MNRKVDLMVGELQEVYRVGVVLDLFEHDPKLQYYLEAARKRFRKLTKEHGDKERHCW